MSSDFFCCLQFVTFGISHIYIKEKLDNPKEKNVTVKTCQMCRGKGAFSVPQGIDDALNQGMTVRGFRSGAGLRVIRIENPSQDDELVGYGEHPHIEVALADAGEDFAQGCRSYSEVYGELYPHYVTGSNSSTSAFDALLLIGHSFTCHKHGGMVYFITKEYNTKILEWRHRAGIGTSFWDAATHAYCEPAEVPCPECSTKGVVHA